MGLGIGLRMISQNPIMSTTIKISSIIETFKIRVAEDGGTFEAESNLLPILNSVDNSIGLNKVNMLLTPNAFKTGKAYNVIGPTDFSILRNTSATRFNSANLIVTEPSNIVRINYKSGTPVILDELQATNLSTFSEELSDISYTKSQVSISSNTFTSPSNVLNADKIIPSVTNSFHTVSKKFTTTSDVVVTFSVFAKASGYNFLVINTPLGSSSGNSGPVIDLVNGTVAGFFGSTNYNAKVVSYPNNWYRIDIQFTTNNTNIQVDLNTFPTSTIGTYSGDSISGVLCWGYSLEVGTSVTSYIPTVASAVTRNKDVITVIPPTGTIKITTLFEDNTTQTLTTIPTTFTIPTGRIKYVLMQHAL